MTRTTEQPSQTHPCFNLELFLRTAGETRLGGRDAATCLSLWEQWFAFLSCKTVAAQGGAFLAVWLGEEVERAVDAAWDESPSHGFLLNALAQTLCMCAVHEHIPEIEEAGCAPAPHASPDLARALSDAGLSVRMTGRMAAPASPDAPPHDDGLLFGRKFAVVTRFPFHGACEVCALLSSCPRAGGSGSFIELG